MAIGSGPPIGEEFTAFKVVDGMIDQESYSAWAKWFKHKVETGGLLFGEGKVCYVDKEKVRAQVEEIKREIEEARVSARSYKA